MDEYTPPPQLMDAKNRSRNQQNALETLWGICEGLLSDKSLNEREVLFLDVWLRENAALLKHDPDAVDLIDLVKDILADGVATPSEIADLRSLLRDILVFRVKREEDERDPLITKTNELLGMVQGIMADRGLNTAEIYRIFAWLEDNPIAKEGWPGKPLAARLQTILEDGQVSEEEILDLSMFLNHTGVSHISLTGSASCGVMTLCVDEVDNLDLTNKNVCLTGRFVTGTRESCVKLLKANGSNWTAKVIQATDYLILGSTPNKQWIHSSYGRKIEDAIKLKETGHPIKIITEYDWDLTL